MSLKYPLIFILFRYQKYFVGTQKRVWISHGIQAMSVQAIEVGLYIVDPYQLHLTT